MRKRPIRWVIVATVGLCSTAVLTGTAYADEPQPVAGCSAASNLSTVANAIGMIDRRIYDDQQWAELVALLEGLDTNGDGYLCWKQFKPNDGQDKQWGATDYVITQLGDNGRSGRLTKSVVV